MTPAIHSDEQTVNAKIERQRQERAAFLQWWREWADRPACNTTFMREIAWESWKAGRARNGGLAESKQASASDRFSA